MSKPIPPPQLVVFSSKSENTIRFAAKLDIPITRLPLTNREETPLMDSPYVLITPTYGAGKIVGSVPPQVLRFLKEPRNSELCVGVMVGGNTTFGEGYCSAGVLISNQIHVPVLYRFEVLGMPEDVRIASEGIRNQWTQLLRMRKQSMKLLTNPV